ncbi:hypothetical protein IKJ53_01575, partial [bacterium]|nr:hypothetical protein [bacterium]
VDDTLTELVEYISDRMTVTDKKLPPVFNFDVDVVTSNNVSGLDYTLTLSDKLLENKKFCTTSRGSENDIKVREETSWNELFSLVVTVWYYQLGIKDADIFATDENDLLMNIGSLINIGEKDFIKDENGNYIELEDGSYIAVQTTYTKDENGEYVVDLNGNYIKFGTNKYYKFDTKYEKDENGNFVESSEGNYIKFEVQDSLDKLNVSVRGDVTVLDNLDTLYYVTKAEFPKSPNHVVSVKSDAIDKIFVAPSYESEYFFKLNNIKINPEGETPETLGVLADNLLIKGFINPNKKSQRSTIYFKLDPNPPYETDESIENKDKHYGGITIIDRRDEDLEEGEVYQPQRFEANSVILRDAEINGNGSVLNVLAADAEIVFRDVIIQDNRSTGLGGAVYTKSDVSIFAETADTIFERNEQNSTSTSTPNKNLNDIYFAKDYTQEGVVQNLNLNAATGQKIVFLSGIDFDKNTKLVLNINPDVVPPVVEEGEEAPIQYDYSGTIRFNGDVASIDKPLACINFNGGTLSFSDDKFTSVYTSDFKVAKETFLNLDINLS